MQGLTPEAVSFISICAARQFIASKGLPALPAAAAEGQEASVILPQVAVHCHWKGTHRPSHLAHPPAAPVPGRSWRARAALR